MPFGKNKRLAMPKANKKKVPAREEMPEIGNEAGVNGAEVLPPALLQLRSRRPGRRAG